jgi:drug/metabolite transporter (DMT)-like permease
LIVARSLTFITGLVLVRLNRLPLLRLAANPTALLAGVLDAGGNVFYILAKQYTRLDIAAVLSSLYPASTVILASIILKEKVSRTQWVGVLICLAAIALISV